MPRTSSATLEFPNVTFVMLSFNFLFMGSLRLVVRCLPQIGTAGGHFGES